MHQTNFQKVLIRKTRYLSLVIK